MSFNSTIRTFGIPASSTVDRAIAFGSLISTASASASQLSRNRKRIVACKNPAPLHPRLPLCRP